MRWFRGQPENRRLERRRVLDVKLRSSQVRARRLRLLAGSLTVLAACVVVGTVLWRGSGWILDQTLFRNEAFALRHIEIQTDGMIAPEQVRQWSGVRPGDNLWRLDLSRIRRELMLVPFVESVAVLRVPPHTLRIRVVEREPVAQALVYRFGTEGSPLATSVKYYLDAGGYVMPPLEAWQGMAMNGQWFEGLPSLSGAAPSDLRPGMPVGSSKVRAALRLLTEFEHSPMVGLADIDRIELGDHGAMVARTAQGAEVTLGLDGFGQQLGRWRAVHELSVSSGRQVASLDLSVSNNLPVRWLETAAVPSPSPSGKAAKGKRPRKRHV